MGQPDSEIEQIEKSAAGWKTAQVYALAVVCLALGLALGYLFRGSQGRAPAAPSTAATSEAPVSAQPASVPEGHPMPTLDEMKKMADAKAAPLLEKLKTDPNNETVLVQLANIYQSTHQFKEAAKYFGDAVQANPKNISVRTALASCLYYDGDSDGAIAQLQQALQYQPKDPNALFNLGMIKWKGKNDAAGAVATWRELLKSNPKLGGDKKTQVQRLIAAASQPPTTN